MEITDIIFVCHSKNNKNVRANELKILEKHADELYFIFGEDNKNTKKRFYDDIETLNADFETLLKIKKQIEEAATIEVTKEPDIIEAEVVEVKTVEETPKMEIKKEKKIDKKTFFKK